MIEVPPDFKAQLYRVLAGNDSTLKDWFMIVAADYIADTTSQTCGACTSKDKRERVNRELS